VFQLILNLHIIQFENQKKSINMSEFYDFPNEVIVKILTLKKLPDVIEYQKESMPFAMMLLYGRK